ncbi:MAG: hypothetical protein ACLQUY_22670 [Ktedonobacterales bacterium]
MFRKHKPDRTRGNANQLATREAEQEDRGDFHLKKWYLDGADDQGNVYIGYQISLRWRNLQLHGYQHLWRTPQHGVKTRGGLTEQPAPVWEDQNRLIWQPDSLQASWDTVDDSIEETLYSTDHGEIRWQCTQPRADMSVHSPHFSFKAWGYTECIDMTIPVWKLPFKTLYWGRCHSKNHCLVWIEWSGATEQNVVWHNGRRSTGVVIEDGRISGPDFAVKLGEDIPLRQGPLISTVFKSFGNVTKLLPRATFLADEHKWYNRGQLETASSSEPAVTIYEEVFW